MTDEASTAWHLDALRRFFLLSYHAEVNRRFLVFRALFPLIEGSRLDLVRLNGAQRVHFVYRTHDKPEHLVTIHDLMIVLGETPPEDERAFVLQALGTREPLVHFVVEAPFDDRFDEVEGIAHAAVARHAATPTRRHRAPKGGTQFHPSSN